MWAVPGANVDQIIGCQAPLGKAARATGTRFQTCMQQTQPQRHVRPWCPRAHRERLEARALAGSRAVGLLSFSCSLGLLRAWHPPGPHQPASPFSSPSGASRAGPPSTLRLHAATLCSHHFSTVPASHNIYCLCSVSALSPNHSMIFSRARTLFHAHVPSTARTSINMHRTKEPR